jgi:hypothetical protein
MKRPHQHRHDGPEDDAAVAHHLVCVAGTKADGPRYWTDPLATGRVAESLVDLSSPARLFGFIWARAETLQFRSQALGVAGDGHARSNGIMRVTHVGAGFVHHKV